MQTRSENGEKEWIDFEIMDPNKCFPDQVIHPAQLPVPLPRGHELGVTVLIFGALKSFYAKHLSRKKIV